MAATGQEVADRVEVLLQDEANVRWGEDELLRWINDGQREAVTINPAACTKARTVSMSAGVRQELPGDVILLVEVISNGDGAAVQQVDKQVLDERRPQWQNERQSPAPRHYAYDPKDAKAFYVYPPNDGNGSADLLYMGIPAPIESLAGEVELDDSYVSALVDYAAYRALSKDAEYTAGSMAGSYYERFHAAVSRRAQLNGVTNGSS